MDDLRGDLDDSQVVSELLNRKARELTALLDARTHPEVASRVQDMLAWIGVAALVVGDVEEALAIGSLEIRDDLREVPMVAENDANVVAVDVGDRVASAVKDFSGRVAIALDLMRIRERSDVLRELSEYRAVLRVLVGARDWSQFREITKALTMVVAEEALGMAFLGTILEILDSGNDKADMVAAASRFAYFARATSAAYFNWSLIARALIRSLEVRDGVVDRSALLMLAQRDLVQLYLRVMRLMPVKSQICCKFGSA